MLLNQLKENYKMIEIKEEDIQHIEKLVLPQYYRFSEDQKNIIRSNDNINIIAAPGSGKTTVLIAKIALVLEKFNADDSKPGLCVLTHTNVAVDEIKNRLKLAGVGNIEYPHFIGTIHDFFNHFFTKKAYNQYFKKDMELLFLEDDEYRKKFINSFNINKPIRYDKNPPTGKIGESYLDFSDSTISLIGDCPDFYKKELITTFNGLLELGFLRHNDTLSLSNWYIDNHIDKIKEAISNRFTFAFFDETQDTNIMQYNLLNKLFKNGKTIVQKFGDPYQALYTIFNNEEDAWVPSEDLSVNSMEISESARFGPSIANILKTTCIENYTVLSGSSTRNSFAPYMFLYESIDNVIPEYINLVKTLANDHLEFKESNKAVYAVGLLHNEVTRYNVKYKAPKNMNGKNFNITNTYYETILGVLLKYLRNNDELLGNDKQQNFSLGYLKKIIEKDINSNGIKLELARIVKKVFSSEGNISDEIENQIYNVYLNIIFLLTSVKLKREILSNKLIIDKELFKNLYTIYKEKNNSPSENIVIDDNITVNFGTIHSVKGETHKATLLLETVRRYGNRNINDCSQIFDFFIGKYDKEKVNSKEVKNALKTAYVALSRPTHLAAVALDKRNLDNLDQKIIDAKKAGWIVLDIN